MISVPCAQLQPDAEQDIVPVFVLPPPGTATAKVAVMNPRLKLCQRGLEMGDSASDPRQDQLEGKGSNGRARLEFASCQLSAVDQKRTFQIRAAKPPPAPHDADAPPDTA